MLKFYIVNTWVYSTTHEYNHGYHERIQAVKNLSDLDFIAESEKQESVYTLEEFVMKFNSPEHTGEYSRINSFYQQLRIIQI